MGIVAVQGLACLDDLERAMTENLIQVIGNKQCLGSTGLCDWLSRQGQEFEYVEQEQHLPSMPILRWGENAENHSEKCTPEKAASLLGFQRRPRHAEYDCVIIGAGPAGLSAAIHAAAEGLRTLLLESYAIGGQMSSSQDVQNYAGWRGTGAALAQRMAAQALVLGAEIIVACPVERVEEPETEYYRVVVVLKDRMLTVKAKGFDAKTKAVVFASGAQPQAIDGCDPQPGVYYGMTQYTLRKIKPGQRVLICGSGNGAGQAAIAARDQGAHVLIVSDKPISETMSDYIVREIDGKIGWDQIHEGFRLNKVTTIDQGDIVAVFGNGEFTVNTTVQQAFLFTGNKPASKWDGTDVNGKFPRRAHSTLGKFAIGDAVEGFQGRIAIAAGQGAGVVVKVLEYIQEGWEHDGDETNPSETESDRSV